MTRREALRNAIDLCRVAVRHTSTRGAWWTTETPLAAARLVASAGCRVESHRLAEFAAFLSAAGRYPGVASHGASYAPNQRTTPPHTGGTS